jgi:hypothetical protein
VCVCVCVCVCVFVCSLWTGPLPNIFVAPLFHLLHAFADDTPRKDVSRKRLTVSLGNHQMAERVRPHCKSCLFYKWLGNDTIRFQNVIHLLGLILTSKLQWSNHVTKSILKTNRELIAIKLMWRFFNTKELIQLLKRNIFSIQFYSNEVWHIKLLNYTIKQSLLATSSNAISLHSITQIAL